MGLANFRTKKISSRLTRARAILLRSRSLLILIMPSYLAHTGRNLGERRPYFEEVSHGEKIQQGEWTKSGKSNARNEAWHAAQRRLRRKSQESQASHCHWAIGSSARGEKSAEEKIEGSKRAIVANLPSTASCDAERGFIRVNARHALSDVRGKCVSAGGLPCALGDAPEGAQFLKLISRVESADSIHVGRKIPGE